ncbi:hypothetical protein ONE63_002969 [Megalurothrips usitatus]|uniref:Uncharacterized protein n=1 Tax=Megalurothrips usitatus TaxID=439358 RepID=A0AAV7X6M7_9NEOP|nr:hypothetical protein ONE63_002969 [Megalurothrips usitatus]
MGVDLLRGGGGRAHFLVASLALLSLFLLFNWWSISTDNLDLLKQIEGLSQHLKSSSGLLDQCRNDRGSLESRVKRLEDDTDKLVQKTDTERQKIDRLENNLKESNTEVEAAKKKFDDASFSLKNCVTELESLKKLDKSKDSMITSLRIGKTDLSNQIQELNEQVTSLNEQLKQVAYNSSISLSLYCISGPQKIENDADNEVRNLQEPAHADEKESVPKGDHIAEKDDQIDERELEMHDNGDEKKV